MIFTLLAVHCELRLPNDCWHHGCGATSVRMKLEECTGSMGSSKPTSCKIDTYWFETPLLVPKRFHAPRFAQYRDKSFNESTSHVHVSLNGICSNCYRFNTPPSTHLSFLYSYVSPQALCVQSKGQPIKKCESEYWRCSHKAAAHFFSMSRMNHSNAWKQMQTPGGVYG